VSDDAGLWCEQRRRLEGAGRCAVAVLGTSRMMSDFDQETFRRRLPHCRAVQIAGPGEGPVRILRDLAEDAQFSGAVICEAGPLVLRRAHWRDLDDYVAKHRTDFFLNDRLNRRIATWFQSRFVLASPHVSLKKTAEWLIRRGCFPRQPRVRLLADRSAVYDHSRTTEAEARRWQEDGRRETLAQAGGADDLRAESWLEDMKEVDALAARIRARGGKVVFVRLPVSHGRLAAEEQLFPREMYWDPFASMTCAVAVNFLDLPGGRDFLCPDSSHLDRADAAAFTGALVDELLKRGVLGPTR
jgi:hypothetical protein